MSVFAFLVGLAGIAVMVICIFLSGNGGGKSDGVVASRPAPVPVWIDDLIGVVDEIYGEESAPYGYVAAEALQTAEAWVRTYGPIGGHLPPELVTR
ncbi:hypothetical protein, partial [Corynebacterium freiburgense]